MLLSRLSLLPLVTLSFACLVGPGPEPTSATEGSESDSEKDPTAVTLGTVTSTLTTMDPTTSSSSSSTTEDETTSTTSSTSYCGDSVVDEGEECDDGNDDNTDACLDTCNNAACGDGFVYVDAEECDLGPDNDDQAECTSDCTINVCGDGFVYNGVEVCDGENGCSESCELEKFLIFVSNEDWDGNLGGVSGANQKCQQAANAANLPGIFRAWIATMEGNEEKSPAQDWTELHDFIGNFIRKDGKVVAEGWDGLVSGSLAVPIIYGEDGVDHGIEKVWTNVKPTGELADIDNESASCSAWSMSTSRSGNVGYPGVSTALWTNTVTPSACNVENHLYCVQISK